MAEKTQAEWIIYKYATEHPELNQKQVAAATGYHQSLVSRTWHKFLAERIRHINKDEPTDMEKRIITYYHAHPGVLQKDIASKLGCHRSTVSHAISRYVTNTTTRKVRNYNHVRKSAQVFLADEKKERHCNMCGRLFVSLWAGNRRCPDCQGKVEYQYMPHYSVYVEGNGRV